MVPTAQNPAPLALTLIMDTVDSHDSEFIRFPYGTNTAIMFWCELHVLDIVYESKEGQANILETNPTTALMAYSLLSYLIAAAEFQVQSVTQALWLAAEMDAISGNSTQFADSFAHDFSRIMTGLFAGITEVAPTTEEWNRDTVLVSQLPKGPLLLLEISLFCFTILSILFLLISFGKRDNRVGTVKDILTDPIGNYQRELWRDNRGSI